MSFTLLSDGIDNDTITIKSADAIVDKLIELNLTRKELLKIIFYKIVVTEKLLLDKIINADKLNVLAALILIIKDFEITEIDLKYIVEGRHLLQLVIADNRYIYLLFKDKYSTAIDVKTLEYISLKELRFGKIQVGASLVVNLKETGEE
jgi:CRISPR/Cas system-associated exonuclease Cas4 (RecB family)